MTVPIYTDTDSFLLRFLPIKNLEPEQYDVKS